MIGNPIDRRRTFAIISHPDAGKTTLTEKLLLFGGAIQLAGEVRAKANRRQTPLRLDEDRARARHLGRHLGDDVRVRRPRLQPARHAGPRGLFRGHLSHADGGRFRRHGDRCRQGHRGRGRASCSRSAACATSRSSPSSTRWTARSRDPFDLLDEIEKTLALDTAPVTWPIGRGRDFAGTYDLRAQRRARGWMPMQARSHAGSPARRSAHRRLLPSERAAEAAARRSSSRARPASRSTWTPSARAI